MKILYIDPVVKSEISRKYKYYDGVFDELCKENQVYLCRNIPDDIKKYSEYINFKPDIVIFGLGWFNHRYFKKINNIDCPSLCILFKPQNDLQEKLNFCKINNINRILTPVPDYKSYEKETGIETILFPYGFNPHVFKQRDMTKKYDIGFSGALHQSKLYPKGAFQAEDLRTKIGEILSSLQDVKVFWNSSDNAQTAFIDSYEEYANTINKSKMWVATQAAYGDITPRFYEVLGSGTLLVCQQIPESYKFLLKDGHNCIEFSNDLCDFEEKVCYYANNAEEVSKITNNALEFFHNKWTWKHRADELIKIAEKL